MTELENATEALKPASLVVISVAPEASVKWIHSDLATQAASRITPKKYLAFLADNPSSLGNKLYLHPVLRIESVESLGKNLIILGAGGCGRSLQPSTPFKLPWSVPCAIDASVHQTLGLRHFDSHSSSTQLFRFDNALWDKYYRAVHEEMRCRTTEEMQEEMDKYHIPLKDRRHWIMPPSPSEPSTIRPSGYPWVPLIQVDVSLDIAALSEIPDHREFDKELREIHRIRRLFCRPEYERTLTWVDDQLQETSYVHRITPDIRHTPIADVPFYLDILFDLRRPRGSNVSDVPSSCSSSSEDSLIMGDEESSLESNEIIAVDLPPVVRQNIKVICIDVFRTLIDQESGVHDALQPMLLRAGSDAQPNEVIRLFGDIEADLQICHESLSYPELLRRVFSILTSQLGIAATTEEEESFVNSVTSWKVFPDAVQAVRRLSAHIPSITLANVDSSTYDTIRGKIDPDNILSGAITVTSQFRPLPRSFQDLITHCKERFNACPEEILMVGSSLFHDLAPAWQMGFPVAWISRTNAVVGSRQAECCYERRPSAIFSTLSDFTLWITDRPPLDEG